MTGDHVSAGDHVWLVIMSGLILPLNPFDGDVYIDGDDDTEPPLRGEKQELARNNVNWDNGDDGMSPLFRYHVYFAQRVSDESLRSMKRPGILQP